MAVWDVAVVWCLMESGSDDGAGRCRWRCVRFCRGGVGLVRPQDAPYIYISGTARIIVRIKSLLCVRVVAGAWRNRWGGWT